MRRERPSWLRKSSDKSDSPDDNGWQTYRVDHKNLQVLHCQYPIFLPRRLWFTRIALLAHVSVLCNLTSILVDNPVLYFPRPVQFTASESFPPVMNVWPSKWWCLTHFSAEEKQFSVLTSFVTGVNKGLKKRAVRTRKRSVRTYAASRTKSIRTALTEALHDQVLVRLHQHDESLPIPPAGVVRLRGRDRGRASRTWLWERPRPPGLRSLEGVVRTGGEWCGLHGRHRTDDQSALRHPPVQCVHRRREWSLLLCEVKAGFRFADAANPRHTDPRLWF